MRKSALFNWTAGLAFLAAPAFAQSNAQSSETPARNEVSVQAFGSFVKSSTNNGIENKATHSGGVLGSYRFFFDKHQGVEVNYGYALNTQSYASGSNFLGVKSYSHEVSAAYVYRFPLRKFTPFALAGAGGLVFDPKDLTGANVQGRAAFIYGAGADFNLSKRVFLRAEYRGLIYNSPTFDLTDLSNADRYTHRAEPSVGFGYRF
jgi:opacity protein-like surface antigen